MASRTAGRWRKKRIYREGSVFLLLTQAHTKSKNWVFSHEACLIFSKKRKVHIEPNLRRLNGSYEKIKWQLSDVEFNEQRFLLQSFHLELRFLEILWEKTEFWEMFNVQLPGGEGDTDMTEDFWYSLKS